jgi:7-cyano-7-deazaguanine synthase
MDSCVCAALAARDRQAAAVHISYGQRTEQRERRSFESICDRLQIRDRLLVRNEALGAIGGSALTDSRIAVPEAKTVDASIPAGVPVTYVPFRNAHFLAVAKKSTLERLSLTVPGIPIAGRSIIERSMKS